MLLERWSVPRRRGVSAGMAVEERQELTDTKVLEDMLGSQCEIGWSHLHSHHASHRDGNTTAMMGAIQKNERMMKMSWRCLHDGIQGAQGLELAS